MADTVIENLITQLSFNFDKEQLKKFNEAMKNAVIGLAAIVAGATAASAAIFSFTKSIAISHDELGKFAQTTGINIKTIQELGFAAELQGGSIDSMTSSLSNLTKIISETSRGLGGSVEIFGILGISVIDAQGKMKKTEDVLNEISDSLVRLGTDAERLEFAEKLGINKDLILTLNQGSAALAGFRKEARELDFIIDTGAAVSAAEFNDELVRTNRLTEGVKNAIGTNLIRQFIPFLKQINGWIKANKELINQNIVLFLDKVKKIIMGVFNVGVRVVGVINKLVQSMGGWKTAIIAVIAVLLAMNATALLMPILVAALAAGIFVIIEDIQKFAEGGDSALGNLADRFPLIRSLAEGLLFVLGGIAEGWKLIFTEGDNALEGLIMMITDFGKELHDKLISPMNDFIDLLNQIPGVNLQKTGTFGTETSGEKFGVGTFGSNAIAESLIEPTADILNAFINQPLLDLANRILGTSFGKIAQAEVLFTPQGSSSITNNTNNRTSNPNITINITGDSPQAIGRVVEEKINNIINGAQENFSSQIDQGA